MEPSVVLIGLLAPVAYALVRFGGIGREAYLFNGGRTSLGLTLASVICGNIGIGTFVALFLFTAQSPVIGYAVAGSYAAGLVLCAALARTIHRASRETDCYGMIDYVARAHGVRHVGLIWLPVAVAFSLRIIVQLMALALIVQGALGLGPSAALALAVAVMGGYTALGGYRVATETDLVQALVILAGIVLVAGGLWRGGVMEAASGAAVFDLGPWGLPFLIAVMVFLPFSAVLAVDNWQRIATAETAGTARRAYLAAAAICAPIYLVLAHVGHLSGAGGGTSLADVLAVFRALMPLGLPILADVMVMVAVMSSIDTFVMPLMSSLGRTSLSLMRIRAVVLVFFVALGLVALAVGDALTGIIAAFNTLVVFLPAVFGALMLGDQAPRAAALSMGMGVAVTLVLSALALDVAALAGFAVSVALYGIGRRMG
ncbi:sodium:solute symporter family transporter [Pararhodobacter aggregans]|uniref:sodium:solute symporter family transporter n=1 Tax=Pararhodobacter aggregans TaxID=404875 RepID=UPI003A938140